MFRILTGLGPNSIHCTMGDNSDWGDNSDCTVLEFPLSFANKRNIMLIYNLNQCKQYASENNGRFHNLLFTKVIMQIMKFSMFVLSFH
jgi:hypothetical protein